MKKRPILTPPADTIIDRLSNKGAVSPTPLAIIFKVEFDGLIGVAVFKKNLLEDTNNAADENGMVFQKSLSREWRSLKESTSNDQFLGLAQKLGYS